MSVALSRAWLEDGLQNKKGNHMTTEQYDWAQARIKELQSPALQPLGLALSWELNDLMTECAVYEDWLVEDSYRGWPGDGSGEDDFADYNQNEGYDC